MVTASIDKTVVVIKSIRGFIESPVAVQEKFNKIAELIAEVMKVEAAACYVGFDETYLELFGAYGFKKDAVNRVTVRYGEGIVGDVAKFKRSISLADVWRYPNFSYKPDIGEENYKSFLGVPLIRWDRAIGVLTVQKEENYEFSDKEKDFLETIAMILSEFVVSDEVNEYKRKVSEEKGAILKDKVRGVSLSKGYGMGNVVVHKRCNAITKIFAENKEFELERLKEAHTKMNDDLDKKFKNTQLGIGQHVDILDAYMMFAKDKGWYKKIESNVESGMTAEAAIERAYEDMWNRLSATTDSYLKERLHDLRDVADRLQSYLRGDFGVTQEIESDNIIVVAKVMGPADLMDYDYTKIRGLIIEDGTPTMHVSIVAKALGIPVIAKIKGIYDEIKSGEFLAIDGEEGYVYTNPSNLIQERIKKKIAERKKQLAKLESLKGLPARSLDDVDFHMFVNIGLSFDIDYIETTNCEGVGLYRTEIPFMSASAMPSVDEQFVFYKELMDRVGDKKATFRSLDVGSDKLLPYWSGVLEENPAIGWRSIRITLDRRAILRKQLRAFLRAAAGKEISIMFPMIADMEEFLEAKETLMIELEKEKKKGNQVPKKVNVGLMVEVPSVVFQLDEILAHADFISIGTNDLSQFIFACDRGNARLNDRYDVLSAPFLRVMKDIVEKANEAGVFCSVCGEMASNPIETLALVGLGFRNFSCSGSSFGKVKSMIRTTRVDEIEDYISSLLKSSQKTFRPQLISYAYDHAIEIY
ncbi:MAG: phosphoenolpyruvate--protein phosphotransferase [Alphaproteobacteria bacterium]|nr:phosphoenolpyruvate--protein phosphotransferase [Alphaproteobacteria bacterium]